MLIVCLQVDDHIYIYILEIIESCFEKFQQPIMVKFDMSDLRLMHYFLGI